MPDYDKLTRNLTARGFQVSFFPTGAAAVDYLTGAIRGCTVGAGGSETLRELGLLEALSRENEVYSHSLPGADRSQAIRQAALAQVYLSSANGLAETGELINIDGRGNRVSATLARHQRVYFVVGRNKIRPDFSGALHRARNIAGPKNAVRLKLNTPCAVRGDRCYDCQSPDRICRALAVLWEKPLGIEHMEIVLVEQELGY